MQKVYLYSGEGVRGDRGGREIAMRRVGQGISHAVFLSVCLYVAVLLAELVRAALVYCRKPSSDGRGCGQECLSLGTTLVHISSGEKCWEISGAHNLYRGPRLQ